MKKVVLSVALATFLLLTGCADKTGVVPADGGGEDSAVTDTSSDDGDEVGVDTGYVDASDSGSAVSFPVVYFAFDSFEISSEQQSVIGELTNAINTSDVNVNFRIEGNCDEWGTEEYNYALGLRRAKSVQDALIAAGISLDKLTLISYGESNPVCAESNRDCWVRNRRVEITVLP
ncbi:MAG: OmpA family protein [Helicobacteraceae bacterium]|jgi:peptidoglycan-associated lipoprotein|nr:OmpA family protein [Helicobacteraceae bacterium]